MLDKLLKAAHLSRRGHSKPADPPDTLRDPRVSPSALRIVHAGGKVECYYMAMPASRIMEKYPSYVLAKPEVFWKPWNSVVRPEKVLRPGQKFLLVPLATVKKLRRRIKKPSGELSSSFESQASIEISDNDLNDVSSVRSGSFISSFGKRSWSRKHVSFAAIEIKHKASGSSNSEKKAKTNDGKKKSSNSGSYRGQRRLRKAGPWQPSLNSIIERHEK